jgi:hypothetical protein
MIELNREWAYRTGWLVKEGTEGPLEIPLVNVAGYELFLTDDGGVVYTQDAWRGTPHDYR